MLLRARLFEGVRRGVLIAESIWPNAAIPDGRGINTLTGADARSRPTAARPSTTTAWRWRRPNRGVEPDDAALAKRLEPA